MKTDKFFEAFTELDDDLVENALPKKNDDYEIIRPAPRSRPWKTYAAAAAAVVVVGGVTIVGVKLFGSGAPFAPAHGVGEMTGINESGAFESGAFDGPSYAHFLGDWQVYSDIEQLVGESDIICEGKVTNISFELLDKNTARSIGDDTDKSNGQLCTIYEVEVKTAYRGVESGETFSFRVPGGLEGYKTDEQLELMKMLGDDAIVVLDDCPEINLGEEYMFLLKDFGSDTLPTILNTTQSAFPLSDREAVEAIRKCLDSGVEDHYTEVSITHDNGILSLSEVDLDALKTAIQNEMTTNLPESQLNTIITEHDIEEYGKSGYVIDMVWNDVDAPLEGGGYNKKAQVIWHAWVLIGTDNKPSYITYSYSALSSDNMVTEHQNGGTYLLSTSARTELLELIGNASPVGNSPDNDIFPGAQSVANSDVSVIYKGETIEVSGKAFADLAGEVHHALVNNCIPENELDHMVFSPVYTVNARYVDYEGSGGSQKILGYTDVEVYICAENEPSYITYLYSVDGTSGQQWGGMYSLGNESRDNILQILEMLNP